MIEVTMTDEIRDFSRPRGTLKFRVDDDVFEAPPDIAAELALQFADEAERLGVGDDGDERPSVASQVQVMHNVIKMILLPDSAERFIARLRDPAHPIGVEVFQEVTEYLLERYGLRPTESDSPSSSGSDNLATGTNSKVSALDEASNFASSATTAS
jgi:hypothetical protein